VNRQDREQFIKNELRGLWPQWNPTDAEVAVWMAELAPLNYALARRAAQAYFASETTYAHRPLLGRFIARVQALSRPTRSGPSQSRDIATDVYLECFEPPEGKPHLAGVRKPVYAQPLSKQSDPDYVAARAESMRRHFDRLYGGRWIVVRSAPPHGMTSRSCQTQQT
jgi:hypothetical protein